MNEDNNEDGFVKVFIFLPFFLYFVFRTSKKNQMKMNTRIKKK